MYWYRNTNEDDHHHTVKIRGFDVSLLPRSISVLPMIIPNNNNNNDKENFLLLGNFKSSISNSQSLLKEIIDNNKKIPTLAPTKVTTLLPTIPPQPPTSCNTYHNDSIPYSGQSTSLSQFTIQQCANDHFGAKLLHRWRVTRKPYCTPPITATTTTTILPQSSPLPNIPMYHCYEFLQYGRGGADNFCEIDHGLFDVRNPAHTPIVVKCTVTPEADGGDHIHVSNRLVPVQYIPWASWIQLDAQYSDGFSHPAAAIATVEHPLHKNPLTNINSQSNHLITNNNDNNNHAPSESTYQQLLEQFPEMYFNASGHVDFPIDSIYRTSMAEMMVHPDPWSQGTTIFILRDCNPPYNPFHCMTAFVDAFQLIVMFNLKWNETRIVFLDDAPESPFWIMWRLLARTVITKNDWLSGIRIVRKISHGFMLQTSSFIWTDFWADKPSCPHTSPLLFTFKRFLLRNFPHVIPKWDTRYRLPCNKRARITIPIREKTKSNTRHFKNLPEILQALSIHFPDVEVVAINFSHLDYWDQVALMYRTDILLGIHGGAMTNLLYLKPTAVVVELHPQSSRARCFENLAHWSGMKYYMWQETQITNHPSEILVNIEEVMKLLDQVLNPLLLIHQK
jgi:hypothetical protein